MPSAISKSEGENFFEHSVPLPAHVYEGDEYFCRYRPRIHRDTRLADAGSWQCQFDFLQSSHEAREGAHRNKNVTSYAVGCINPTVGNFTALCASEALPERLALTTYMVEYAYIHDDVIEYSVSKDEQKLVEANQQLMEGLTMEEKKTSGSKDHVKRRQLQAKMVMEMMEMDKKAAQECLRLWKEMSDVFVQIRDMKFEVIDDYLKFRAVDAGCPWTMSLLCFSMDYTLTADEEKKTAAITSAAYDAWVLVNDYFSWEKELKNYESNGSKGVIANAIFLFMKWHSIPHQEAKKMLKKEIIAREKAYQQAKDDFIATGAATQRTYKWMKLLDLVTAGNFAWSMTTARYIMGGEDSYPAIRQECYNTSNFGVGDSLGTSISQSADKIADKIDPALDPRKYLFVDAKEEEEPEPDRVVNQHDENKKQDGQKTNGHQQKNGHQRTNGHQKPRFEKTKVHDYEELILEPFTYVDSMPSKGVRNAVIDGLETWYNVPEDSLVVIRKIIGKLHNASLMLDDIQDNSPLRRGLPATHVIFGINQTMNTANLVIFKALQEADALSPLAVRILVNALIDGHLGQGLDLHWTRSTKIPSEEEYFAMVDGKTGALFILLADLMRAEATTNTKVDATLLMKITGRFFQARDDFKNLDDQKYTDEKGYADDIGEGKISLPLIYACRNDSPQRGQLLSMLQERKVNNDLCLDVRKLAVDAIKASGGLEFSKRTAIGLQKAVNETLAAYEEKVGEKNWLLRLALKRLELEA